MQTRATANDKDRSINDDGHRSPRLGDVALYSSQWKCLHQSHHLARLILTWSAALKEENQVRAMAIGTLLTLYRARVLQSLYYLDPERVYSED